MTPPLDLPRSAAFGGCDPNRSTTRWAVPLATLLSISISAVCLGQQPANAPPCIPFSTPIPAGLLTPPKLETPVPAPVPEVPVEAVPIETPAKPRVAVPQVSAELTGTPTLVPSQYDAIDARIRELRSRIKRAEAPLTLPVPMIAPAAPPTADVTVTTPDLVVPMNPDHPQVVPDATLEAPSSISPAAPQTSIPAQSSDPHQDSVLLAPHREPDHADPHSPLAATTAPLLKPSTALAETSESLSSSMLIPVEILRSPLDQIALADSLYAARSFTLAVEAYRAAEKSPPHLAGRRWASFQVANCLRQAGQIAEAEKQYRRVAGDRDAGESAELAKWWLHALEQKGQLSAQLTSIQSALSVTSEPDHVQPVDKP